MRAIKTKNSEKYGFRGKLWGNKRSWVEKLGTPRIRIAKQQVFWLLLLLLLFAVRYNCYALRSRPYACAILHRTVGWPLARAPILKQTDARSHLSKNENKDKNIGIWCDTSAASEKHPSVFKISIASHRGIGQHMCSNLTAARSWGQIACDRRVWQVKRVLLFDRAPWMLVVYSTRSFRGRRSFCPHALGLFLSSRCKWSQTIDWKRTPEMLLFELERKWSWILGWREHWEPLDARQMFFFFSFRKGEREKQR